jgi:hypothetical protein
MPDWKDLRTPDEKLGWLRDQILRLGDAHNRLATLHVIIDKKLSDYIRLIPSPPKEVRRHLTAAGVSGKDCANSSR